MNIGKDCRHPKYICDKCGNAIHYIEKKGFEGLNKYYKEAKYDYAHKKDFDLCGNCEKKFREWLKQKEITTTIELINRFPRWER